MQKAELKKLRFFYLDQAFHFPARSRLKHFLLELFKSEGLSVEAVNYIFCSDRFLLDINQSHLHHNTLTDIITFQYSPPGEAVLSDIYISIERVKENAEIFQVGFLDELYRVMFHGALHLCGYKDKSKNDIRRMRAAEDKYLTKYKA